MNLNKAMKQTKTTFICRAAILLVFALFTTVGAWADGTKYDYVDADAQPCSHEATVLTGSTDPTTLDAGWYVATGNVTYTGQLQFSSGDVHLILCNNATLTINSGTTNALQVDGNLTIYCQCATGTENIGALVATSGATQVSHDGIHANNNGNITINGGNITATSSTGDGISTAGIITINSGIINATAQNSNKHGLRAHAINLSWYSDNEDRITATSYYVERNSSTSFSNIPSVITAYKPFKDSDNNIYSGILTTAQISAIAGKTLYPFPCVFLYNHKHNYINNDNEPKNVCLQGRTLFKDGAWNTLCLPFSLGNANADYGHYFDGTPLEGATLMELSGNMTGFDPSTRTLYLFFKNATIIEAGKPYIIKWDGDGTNNIVSPVFTGVTVTTYAAYGVSNENNEYTVRVKNNNLNAVEFRGSYSPVSLTPNDKSVLFLGAQNKLYWPNAANNDSGKYQLNSCRAYFWVDLDGTANVSAFVLDFGEGETTEIKTTDFTDYTDKAGVWYTLDGRRIANGQKPTAKGIYINNGHKIVIK